MTVDEYIDQAPEPHRTTLTQLRTTLRDILPGATETISYGKPAFEVGGNAVAGYAYFKGHCSYFPHSGTVLADLADELDAYEWSKGALKFPPDQPPPRKLLKHLVEAKLGELGSQ